MISRAACYTFPVILNTENLTTKTYKKGPLVYINRELIKCESIQDNARTAVSLILYNLRSTSWDKQ